MENPTDKKRFWDKHSNWLIPVIAIILCIGIWYGGMHTSYWLANKLFVLDPEEPNTHKALFGDSFGAVNALISAFAFAGVIVSMVLQRKELSYQRQSLDTQQKELKQNTKELELQRKEFQMQNETMKLQRFENTFFNMLDLQQEIINNLQLSYYTTAKGNTQTAQGREVFKVFYETAAFERKEYIGGGHFKEDMKAHGLKQYIYINGIESYKRSGFQDIADHYFIHLYGVLKYIDETSFLSKNQKYFYASSLRATLSKYELLILFLNGLFNERFKLLIEEYSLFSNLNKESLPKEKDPSSKSKYEESAYNPDLKGYNKIIKD